VQGLGLVVLGGGMLLILVLVLVAALVAVPIFLKHRQAHLK
jgi:hypothetical protein